MCCKATTVGDTLICGEFGWKCWTVDVSARSVQGKGSGLMFFCGDMGESGVRNVSHVVQETVLGALSQGSVCGMRRHCATATYLCETSHNRKL